MDEKKLQQIHEDSWDKAVERNVHPRIPRSVLTTDKSVPTASFNSATLETHVNSNFVKELMGSGMDAYRAMQALHMHELGHHFVLPADLGTFFRYATAAKQVLDQESDVYKKDCINYFFDVGVNLDIMRRKIAGDELRELIAVTTKQENTSDVFKLLSGFFDKKLDYFDSPFFDSELYLNNKEDMDTRLEALDSIDYYNKWMEGPYLLGFSDIIKPLWEQDEQRAAKQMQSGGEEATNTRQKMSDLLDSLDDIIKELDPRQVQTTLDELAQSAPRKRQYDAIKKTIESIRKESMNRKSKTKSGGSGAGIGDESTDLKFNDDLIDYYDRLSRKYGVYIFKKPMEIDEDILTPLTNADYSPDDSMSKLLPFSAPFILPGISKRSEDIALPKVHMGFDIPAALLSIDTSASMKDPSVETSHATTAGFVIANNYHANGSPVGVFNFSVESSMLLPTRDLQQVHSMLCAFYGGGTHYNLEKFQKFVELMAAADKRKYKGLDLNKEADRNKVIQELDIQVIESFKEKNLTVQFGDQTKRMLNKLDVHMFTDLGIANLEEVVGYYNSMAEITRKFIYVFDQYEKVVEARALGLENTVIYNIESNEDLMNITIGNIKQLKGKNQKARW